MAFHELLGILAFGAVLLLDQATKVESCSCSPNSGGLCGYVDTSHVVLHATVLSRSEQVDSSDDETYTGENRVVAINNDDVTYTVAVNTLYKEEPNVAYGQKLNIVTAANGAMCGISLKLHEEYLIGLYRTGGSVFNPEQESQLNANLCRLVRVWSSVTDEEMALLEAGCGEDPCDGRCSEFQECLFYNDSFTAEYYCADVCDPSPCDEGEMCILQYVLCPRAPCPPLSACIGSGD